MTTKNNLNQHATARAAYAAHDMIIEAIALRMLDIPTLRTRNSDALDFYDIGVEDLRRALNEAYAAGSDAGRERAIALAEDALDLAAESPAPLEDSECGDKDAVLAWFEKYHIWHAMASSAAEEVLGGKNDPDGPAPDNEPMSVEELDASEVNRLRAALQELVGAYEIQRCGADGGMYALNWARAALAQGGAS